MEATDSDLLEVQGNTSRSVFGISPATRLGRQVAARRVRLVDRKLFADANCILSDPTLDWMIDHPGQMVLSAGGRSKAVIVERGISLDLARLDAGPDLAPQGIVIAGKNDLSGLFNRKLRRRQSGLVLSTLEANAGATEWALFKDVYKGVTDIITRYVWPVPAFMLVRLFSRIGISANMVTLCGIALTFATALLFLRQNFAGALAAGWVMTLLDTVDGKLARVTATSSKLGDKLDHIPDLLHPPMWWACLAIGLVRASPASTEAIYLSMEVILATYLLGRIVEVAFKRRNGFNQYLWRPGDALLRLIIARRNTILLVLTVGLAIGWLETAFHAAAIWSVLTIGIQPLRLLSAEWLRRRGKMPEPWLG